MADQNKTVAATHDSQTPQALVDFMMTGWKKRTPKRVASVKGGKQYAARRKRLSEIFPHDILVIPTGSEKIRANDTSYRFRPGSDFFYLTGNQEPDCVLVLAPTATHHQCVLFVEPEIDRTTPAFFTDRIRGALWVGERLGLEGSRHRYAVDETRGITTLFDFLDQIRSNWPSLRLLRGISPTLDSKIPPREQEDAELATALAQMRLRKDSSEIRSLRQAIAYTHRAHEAAIFALKNAQRENEVEAAFNAQARREGTDVGFPTIVASGPHATVLHWTHNHGLIKKGDLILVDAGVEAEDLYTGDVTRTYPAKGRFSPEQKRLYDLVVRAQDAAIAAVKPGSDFLEPHRAASKVLAEGLERLGILKEPATTALQEDRQTFKRYCLHSTSHMLGIDVHDVSAIPYRQGKLEPGMVLTIEPGLYFQEDDLTVPTVYRGIGIRIEDNVLVTRTGCQVLTAEIPRRAAEVEAWMAKIWKRKEPISKPASSR